MALPPLNLRQDWGDWMQRLNEVRAGHPGHIIDLRRVRAFGALSVRVWKGNAVHIRSDAIVCGRLTPINPLGILYSDRDYWFAGLDFGPTETCPPHLYQPQTEINVVKVDRPWVAAQWIGIINPTAAPDGIEAQLVATVQSLVGNRYRCPRVSIVSPWHNIEDVNAFTRGIRALVNDPPPGLLVLNLIDYDDPTPFDRLVADLALMPDED